MLVDWAFNKKINKVSMMESINELEYCEKLVNMGVGVDVAQEVASKTAKSRKKAPHKPAQQQAKQAANESIAEVEASFPVKAPTSKTKKRDAPPTKRELKLIDTGVTIKTEGPTGKDLAFMHSIMCQVGLPRSKVDGLEFERTCGGAGLYIRAGKLWDGKKFIQQPIPYGPMPRLVMAYVNTQALRSKSPEIEVGNSASDFLKQLGKDSTGGKRGSYTNFRKQIMALSACSMTIGFTTADTVITYDGKPIQRFEAWISNQDEQGVLWPGTITFSQEYFQTLALHAVPLDLRALNALSSSALAMDIYVWLAERLHRIINRPLLLHWQSLREQFGQEYLGPEADKNFKKSFLPALTKVLTVYPQAKVKHVTGGILLMASPPPISHRSPQA